MPLGTSANLYYLLNSFFFNGIRPDVIDVYFALLVHATNSRRLMH